MRASSGFLLAVAGFTILFALACQNITVVGSYAEVLLVAITCTVIADLCCGVVFARGGGLRWVAVVIALPSLFIVWDFLRRAPYAF